MTNMPSDVVCAWLHNSKHIFISSLVQKQKRRKIKKKNMHKKENLKSSISEPFKL